MAMLNGSDLLAQNQEIKSKSHQIHRTLGFFLSGLLVLPSSVTLAATLTTEVHRESLLITEPTAIAPETLAAQFFVSAVSEVDDPAFFAANAPSLIPSTLSFDAVVDSIGRLRFNTPDLKAIAEVSTLSQVPSSQVMQGIYDFPSSPISPASSDFFVFEDNSLKLSSRPPAVTPSSKITSPNNQANLPSNGGISPSGIRVPSYAGINVLNSPQVSSVLAPSVGNGSHSSGTPNSIRAQLIQLFQDGIDARWDLYPNGEFSKTPQEWKANLSDQARQLDQIYRLDVGVALPTAPKNIFLTPLDLKDDYAKNSPILSRDYANAFFQVSDDFRDFLQENAQKQGQAITEIQQNRQTTSYKRNKSLPSAYKLYPDNSEKNNKKRANYTPFGR